MASSNISTRDGGLAGRVGSGSDTGACQRLPSFCRRALIDPLGIPYERVDAGGEYGGTREPEYLAMNPTALIPTIRDDGYAL